MLIRFALLCSVLTLVACGNERANVGSNIPGSNQKSLNLREQAQIIDFAGALGDAMFFTETAVDSIIQKKGRLDGYEARPIVSRKTYRDNLRRSAKLNRCNATKSGDFNDDSSLVEVNGRRCGVETLFEQNRNSLPAPAGVAKNEIEYQKFFSIRRDSVETDIAEADLRARIQTERQLNTENTATINSATITITGESRDLGEFTYSLSETYRRLDPIQSNREVVVYKRTDRIEMARGLVAVLYRKLDVVRGEISSLEYYLNGEQITDEVYYRMLQDLDRQVGLERYN